MDAPDMYRGHSIGKAALNKAADSIQGMTPEFSGVAPVG